MKLIKNYSLKYLNAYKVDATTKYFALINKLKELDEVLKSDLIKERIFILGEGYNTLFEDNFDGLIIKINLKGIDILKETKDHVLLEVGAGENWDKLVKFTVDSGYSGIENLALIPGTVGAAPVQNIAAYGKNLDDVFHSLTAVNIFTKEFINFKKTDCKFGYRTSYFKQEGKNKFIITKVRLKLSKKSNYNLDYYSRYESVSDELKTFAKEPYTSKDVYQAVIRIRKRKLPDYEKYGTAGSVFLNPIVSKEKLKQLNKNFPDLQFYPTSKLMYKKPDDPGYKNSNNVKVPAGWLFDEIGWKGKRIGNVGTWDNHALVVVNYGNANGKEVSNFINEMKNSFNKNFNITLSPEINIV